MFQASRQFFHRSPSGTVARTADSDAPTKAEGSQRPAERHPAMRGLDVSPVHGHHCICGRCEQRSDAA